MHRIFGSKENIQYCDREGAYFIPVYNRKIGVIHTPKGYFFVGGGIENGESHSDCVKRESLEETGYTVSVGAKVCSAETYCFHNEIGYFHPSRPIIQVNLLQKYPHRQKMTMNSCRSITKTSKEKCSGKCRTGHWILYTNNTYSDYR